MELRNKKVLVTGGAGFIGSHLTEKLLTENNYVNVVDNFDNFYDVEIKKRNISTFLDSPLFSLSKIDICNSDALEQLETPDVIVHLAAMAGVQPSIQNPSAYQSVNVGGTVNMLDFARNRKVKQFIFASSSSVYGNSPDTPWKENHFVLNPISPYAATKISGELLGHTYSHLFDIRFIALRFFTVYGPRQRPDLAIHKFSRLMLTGKPIPFFGKGNTARDYTFISDIIEGILSAIMYKKTNFEIFNLGNNNTVTLNELIETMEKVYNISAIRNILPEQPGDVFKTYADISKSKRLLNYEPKILLEEGITIFQKWLIQQKLN